MLAVIMLKASWEDFQKPVPTMAVMMKAFLLMYLTTFSSTRKQPRKHQRRPRPHLLLLVALRTFWLMNSTASLKICTTARMKDPQARVPRWYFRVRLNDFLGRREWHLKLEVK